LRVRAIQEPVFPVANTDFKGGYDGYGYGDCIFLVIYAQPSHSGFNFRRKIATWIQKPEVRSALKNP
jgi:hypothetical protein